MLRKHNAQSRARGPRELCMSLNKTIFSRSKTPSKLAALTAVVLLAHGSLLHGTPVVMAAYSPDSSASFSTRLLTLQPASESLGLPPPAALLMPAEVAPQRIRRREASPQPLNNVRLPPMASPTTLRDDVDPDAPTLMVDPSQAVDGAHQAAVQLLGAAGPPANLSSAGATALIAGHDDIKFAQAVIPEPANPAPARAASSKAVQSYSFPPPLHLKYTIRGEIKGFPAYLKGDLQWKQDGKSYDARLEISHFLLGSRVQTSRGELGSQGLEPVRFGDKRGPEVAAHFDRAKSKVTFSANSPDGALLPGTQDHLSVFMQLASMIGGAPASFPEGTAIPFEAVGPRSIETWVFKVGSLEKLALPGGSIAAVKLTRDAVGAYGTRGEVWLAPTIGYLPVRIRLTESNGDLMDLRWSETVAP
ncbi:MAG: DUF3108 domain-containing protein [Candidatus Saccharibacteria bacterium]|nr:DUF3108 domain-containing protein [Rhodoferax sp.]